MTSPKTAREGMEMAAKICLDRAEIHKNAASLASLEGRVEAYKGERLMENSARLCYSLIRALASSLPAEQELVEENERLRYKLADIRACFLGIDQQAERLIGPPLLSNWKAEEIVIGYKLNTGLWHRIHGLLADVTEIAAEPAALPEGPIDPHQKFHWVWQFEDKSIDDKLHATEKYCQIAADEEMKLDPSVGKISVVKVLVSAAPKPDEEGR